MKIKLKREIGMLDIVRLIDIASKSIRTVACKVDGDSVDMKSVLGILSLALHKGNEIEIESIDKEVLIKLKDYLDKE